MFALRTGSPLALVMILCVLTIFLCPTPSGPYSAMHGPVTALLAMRTAARVRLTIVRSGLTAIRNGLENARAALIPLRWSDTFFTECRIDCFSAEPSSVLRC
jgi:hypothetical protein